MPRYQGKARMMQFPGSLQPEPISTPAQVARLNFNVKVTYYLSKAVAARKAEDKVLKQEEEEIGAARNAIPDALGNGAQHVALVVRVWREAEAR